MLQDSTQTTGTPNSGASNAQDFQPTTRNPQLPVNPLQQQSGLQESTDAQQVLGAQQDARISVPINPAQAPRPAQAEAGNMTGLVLLLSVMALILILALAHFIRKRGKIRILPETDYAEDKETKTETEVAPVMDEQPP